MLTSLYLYGYPLDGLYDKHFNTLEKLRLWFSFESATPAVNHPDGEVDVSKVDKMVCFHFTITTWSTDAMLFSLFGLKKNKALQEKKTFTR
jgi:hypothetical protein